MCYTNNVNNPQVEAANILKSVLDDYFNGRQDISSFLRRCQHACEIMNWQDQKSWFKHELEGYPQGIEIPWYRIIKGEIKWVPDLDLLTLLGTMYEGYPKPRGRMREVTLEVWWGIDNLLYCGQNGYTEKTGKSRKPSRASSRGATIEEEKKIFKAESFQDILLRIKNSTFAFASSAYSTLCYSDAIHDIWQTRRIKVDECLASIGLGNNLDAIRAGMKSNNPEALRNAVFGCRNLLNDLASYLWLDPRKTYEHLDNADKTGKIDVTSNKYVNRFKAYLHQKAVFGTTAEYLRTEWDRISYSIDRLVDLCSKAHKTITQEDVLTAVIGTYVILGELVTRTDMKPINEYKNPQSTT